MWCFNLNVDANVHCGCVYIWLGDHATEALYLIVTFNDSGAQLVQLVLG
jgi:hypothetical protein